MIQSLYSCRRAPRNASLAIDRGGRCARRVLMALAFAFLGTLPVLPLVVVFVEAFAQGVGAYLRKRSASPTRSSAIRLTLLVAAISVPLNLVFGIAAAWADRQVRIQGQGLPASR